jgi:predicted TIM-barrel fold metal-dependent hydrolase
MTGELLLSQYVPRSTLVVDQHEVRRAKSPAIDAHSHLGRWLTPDRSWAVPDIAEALRTLDGCNIVTIVNLDGMWGDELEENLDRYDRAYPDRFITFAQVDWTLVQGPDFGTSMARQLEDSVRRGARGLKVWKHLGLRYRDSRGDLIPVDDERLSDLWETAAMLQVPVMIHVADPVAFFQPLDAYNERWDELLLHPDWHFHGPEYPAFEAVMAQFERLIARHPDTIFIGAHVGCYPENLGWVSRMLNTYPNFYVDMAQRIGELGRQPYSAKRLFERHPDRILFGMDTFPPRADCSAPYFRFLETADEYFPYCPHEVGNQGRWHIHGLALPDDILYQVYHDTAKRLLDLAGCRGKVASQ